MGGDGVGRLSDGRVVFVPRTVPGDRIRLREGSLVRHRNFARAEAGEIVEAGPPLGRRRRRGRVRFPRPPARPARGTRAGGPRPTRGGRRGRRAETGGGGGGAGGGRAGGAAGGGGPGGAGRRGGGGGARHGVPRH